MLIPFTLNVWSGSVTKNRAHTLMDQENKPNTLFHKQIHQSSHMKAHRITSNAQREWKTILLWTNETTSFLEHFNSIHFSRGWVRITIDLFNVFSFMESSIESNRYVLNADSAHLLMAGAIFPCHAWERTKKKLTLLLSKKKLLVLLCHTEFRLTRLKSFLTFLLANQRANVNLSSVYNYTVRESFIN